MYQRGILPTDLITSITALLERWDQLAAEASQKAETTDQILQASFYAGLTFGIQSTRNNLATTLENALTEANKQSASVM